MAADLPTQQRDPRLDRALETRTRYLEAHGGDAASAISELEGDISDRARRISITGHGHSMFDLLDCVRYVETAIDSNSYRESSRQGSELVVELVAASLTATPYPAPEGAPPAAEKTPLAEAALWVLDLGHELFNLVAARQHIAEDDDFDPAMPANVAVQRELFMRGTTYAHICKPLLTSLFATSEIEALCRRVLGFTGGQACEVVAAIRQRCDASVGETHRRMESLSDTERSMVEAAMHAPPSVGRDGAQRHRGQALLHEVVGRVFFPVPAVSTFSAPELAEATGIEVSAVEKVLTALCYRAHQLDAGRAVEQAVRGPSPFRAAPILRDGDRYFMTHCSFGLQVVREAIESRFRGTSNWQPYQKPRGRFLESEALKLLSTMLPTAQVHSSIEYLKPLPDTAEASGPPERYTQKCEADGLLIVDDIALIVEAKAGSLRARSRSGHGPTLKANLKSLIREASDQAKRLHELIERDGRIRLTDKSWIDMSAVREVHPIAVSLEDLSGFATAAAGLFKAEIISPDYVPWMVSLHDLHVISEIVRHGSELIVYVRRRTHPDIVGTYFSVDELDYFMAFLGWGLQAGREPHLAVLAEIPGAAPPAGSGAASPQQSWKILNSHTEPLDDWYRFKHGSRTIATPCPALRTDPLIRAIVDAPAMQAEPNWVSISAALLDRDLPAQRQLVHSISSVLYRTSVDGRSCTVCPAGGDPASQTSTLILSTMADGEDIGAATERLTSHMTAMRHQEQTAVVVGLLFRTQDSGVPSVSVYESTRSRQPKA